MGVRKEDHDELKGGTWPACIYARPWSLSPSDRCRTTSIECVRGSVKKSLLARLVPLSSYDGKNVRDLQRLAIRTRYLPAPSSTPSDAGGGGRPFGRFVRAAQKL
jgi:hypothetical protein